jgi:hypothetical protein
MESDWESEEEGQTFRPSIKAYERVGLPGAAIGALLGTIMTDNLEDLQKNINRAVQDPTDRFIILVNAISRKLMSTEVIKINEDELVSILLKIKEIKNVGCKNPTAFILGYIASKGGSKITKNSANKVFEILRKLDNRDSIKEADCIRYARYWMTL